MEIENASATEKIMSFTPNYEDLSVELAQITAVFEEHTMDVTLDDAAYEASKQEIKDQLYAAGMQTVLDNLQEQIDAWLG